MKYIHQDYQDKVWNEINKSNFKSYHKPHYKKYSLANLAPTILSHFGKKSKNILNDNLIQTSLDGCQSIVLILIDGLGFNLIKNSLHNPLLDKLYYNNIVIPITSTFPSTTSTALSTVNTGMTPQQHGIIGHTMYLRKYGTIANMVNFSPESDRNSSRLTKFGFDPETFLTNNTLYQSLSDIDVKSKVLTRWIYKKSALSRMLHKGSDVLPYVNSSDMFLNLSKIVNKKTPFTFVYWDVLDSASHVYGPFTPEVQSELRNILFGLLNEFIKNIKTQYRNKVCIFITGDHGLVQVNKTGRMFTNNIPKFLDNLSRPPSGDSRTSFVKLDNSNNNLKNIFQKYKNQFDIFPSDKFIKEGFFGSKTVNRDISSALGDYTILSRKGNVLMHRFKSDFKASLSGYHGGLTDDELFVPLFVVNPKNLD
ncbi:MAG: alkaline phosphatase family protein [Thaumarchaeota archaeon]|nr:alkaline phosphatase family protein [Nitrososphaerota archaeon]NSL75102.1 alkaline phosphatase family protein [Nitrososphaerota archaeon]NSL77412.1 alkaline phosphatase family protein [Nitrososphaerota archaeon]